MQAKCYIIDVRGLSRGAARKLLNRDTAIRCAGISLALLVGMESSTFAASNTGIDVGANRLYKKLLNIGKWVLIVKGGLDTIKSATEGDLQSAKKNFLGYGLTYLILRGLPWSFGQIEKLFDDVEASAP